ncbi:glycosyl hydrolase 5 family protein-like [Coffea arabica]|uniref:Glycosyl hydrolase 5 family protein-like n=1 Tax=Coffea arabica TaxID=13443 RepID=A0ABM4UET8_COFAR
MGENPSDNKFLPCFMAYLAHHGLDWALWALQASYYLRDGHQDHDETYGMFNSNWRHLRSPEFHSKLQFLYQKLQDPKSDGRSYKILYHLLSGKCARANKNNDIYVSECWEMSKWDHQGEGTPTILQGTRSCLKAIGDGLLVALTIDCKSNQRKWTLTSNSQFQLASKHENGTELCLDWDPYYS